MFKKSMILSVLTGALLISTALAEPVTVVKKTLHDCILAGKMVEKSVIADKINGMGLKLDKTLSMLKKDLRLNASCVVRARVKDKTNQSWFLYFDPNNGNLIAKQKRFAVA